MNMTNHCNHFIYRLWMPVYDAALGHFFLPRRKRALELLNLQPGKKVLVVGVSIGADLPLLLPSGFNATSIDISSKMLTKAASNWISIPLTLN